MKHLILPAVTAALLAAATLTTSDARADTPTPSPAQQITSDIVVEMNDSYGPGDIATINIRNNGTVAYQVPLQPVCMPTYKDATGRNVIVAGHCDLIGFGAPLQPGNGINLISAWRLEECVEPGFFCNLFRPLPSGSYTVSGAMTSVDGLFRAEFSKTFSVTGPQFKNDVTLTIKTVAGNSPVTSASSPVRIEMTNTGQTEYKYLSEYGCYMRFGRPDGFRFTIPGTYGGGCGTEETLSAGETVTVVNEWKLDECVEFGSATCTKAVPLTPAAYPISGALYSTDNQSYVEFSNTFTIQAPAPVSPTPKDLPPSGGAIGQAPATSAIVLLGAVLVGFGFLALVSAGPRRTAKSG